MVHRVSVQRVLRAVSSLLAALVLAIVALPARAADNAVLDILGYSPDFRYFAFEQYGIQDGSGFPYAEIVLIDLETDRFVGGAPFRVRLEDMDVRLNDARAQVRAVAQPALARFDIAEPARIIAMIADGQWGADDTRLQFGIPSYSLMAPSGEYEVSLELFPADTSADCVEWFGERPVGFALFFDNGRGPRELHRDTRVPASRNCVITYKTYGVVMPLHSVDIADAVAILSVHSWGFEGADRRFIALPLGHAD